jgi:protocatechuate 3,4-dioxygenase beta subunit
MNRGAKHPFWGVIIHQGRIRLAAAMLVFMIANTLNAGQFKCAPTPGDDEGPFYQPNAPVRSSVGKGYQLSGTTMSAKDCSAVAGAKIEFWLAGSDGRYDDEHRATVLTDESGAYRFESNVPPRYTSRPPHIHIRVTAENFETLVTQHYPKNGTSEDTFPLVLIPR